MVSFAFCFFVFLQVKSNGVVIVTFSFVLTLDIGLCFLFFFMLTVCCVVVWMMCYGASMGCYISEEF